MRVGSVQEQVPILIWAVTTNRAYPAGALPAGMGQLLEEDAGGASAG